MWQEAAWGEIDSYEWWYQQHYNLPPTDPRLLSATAQEVKLEYFKYKLSEDIAKAVKDGKPYGTLDEVLAGSDTGFEEQLRQFDERLEAEAMAKEREREAALLVAAQDNTEEVISFKGTPRG
jgi:hypothetical protein